MTTSFTSTSFTSTETNDDFGEFSNYPVAFGITFTPKVSGIAAGIGGCLIAAYLIWSQVLPALNSYNQLQQDKLQKEQQLSQLKTLKVETKIQAKKAELQEAQDIQAEVIKLFTQENHLETLLIDVNSFVNATNVQLNSYTPGSETEVTDSSFGELANGKIKTKSYNLNVEGSFAQLQLFLQDIERLQPLLVIREFSASIMNEQNYLLQQDKVVVTGQPKLQTTMTVNAVFPTGK